ncbi:uncharacterized protein LOC112528156 isoform X2 [Cynara cardunculus var. scolymus]|uniref:uncharacterized protein LOC112528156 isoform X2 n=1 Tax=Cynara cardunculus var. scolymus TaxID=59895 RepID=UPI000D62D049|nr:uncharacterized protein LOC112528156 isoform X2 [Cynara cardunculus var. scolymus]
MAATDATSTGDDINEESINKWESLRLKTLAEQTYSSSDLKLAIKYAKRAQRLCPTLDGVSEMLTAFKILSAAANTIEATTTPHWYKILEVRRKEYDMKLRIALQTAVEAEVESGGGAVAEDTFWTACSTCRLLHQFDRKYFGHNLMCPSCRKTFKAMEVEDGKKAMVGDERDGVDTMESDRIRNVSDPKRKMSSVGEIMKRSEQSKKIDRSKIENVSKLSTGLNKEDNGSRVRDNEPLKEKTTNDEDEEDMMTLAEIQRLVKTNVKEDNLKVKGKDKVQRSRNSKNEKSGNSKNKKSGSKRADSRNETNGEGKKNQDIEIMPVEDSDFYDFDKGRVERSFKKGQVWALYDDDDGMPRHYGLIDEVVSTHPFEVDMAWLDPQTNCDEGLISLERMGFHISCGMFKVSKKTKITSLNVFSHIVDCERAAREVYRIYPKKGSVWALYSQNDELVRENRRYDIVVFLTSYSEVYGLSMGYLQKVNGFKTIFRRQEIGCHAIKWLEKHVVRLFSHQIPARKLSGEEAADLSGDCWELDPASLPPDLITVGRQNQGLLVHK